MTAILALYQRTGAPADQTILHQMLAAGRYRQTDGEDLWLDGHVALAHQHAWIAPEEVGERQPTLDTATGCVITCDVRLDNRAALAASLHLPVAASDTLLILQAYLRWGADCLSQLEGAFAFVIWDPRDQRLLVARDPVGERAVCYYADSRCVLVASEFAPLLAHPEVRAALNETEIAEFLDGVWDYGEETCYRGIFYCPPAHAILFDAAGMVRWRYWNIEPGKRIRYRSHQEYVEHFASLFSEAVTCRLRTRWPVGVTLSGGLDSTSVAVTAAQHLTEHGARLHSFSYVFDELAQSDERAYIAPVVAQHAIEATLVPCDDLWTLRDLPHWPIYRDSAAQDPGVWMLHAALRSAKEHGCRVVLTGIGGDELFLGGQLWALDALREGRLPGLLPELLRRRDAIRWRSDLFDNGMRQLLPVSIRRIYRQHRSGSIWNPGLNVELAARVGLPRRHLAHRYHADYTAPGQWQRYRGLIDNATVENSALLRQLGLSYGLEITHPFLDRRLIEFAMATPADELALPGRTKRLLRDAMAGRLPEPVRQRVGKASFVPLVEKGLLDRERATVAALLADPQVVRMGFIRDAWLAQEVRAGPGWTDGGYWLWLALCLELWLRRYW